MRLSNKALSELVANIVGEDVVPVVQLIKDKKNVSEFKIAERLKKTVNEVRNKLYRLHAQNLVFFTRKKDKIKGWYIYYWTFNFKRAKELAEGLRQKSLDLLKKRLEREEKGNFFICKEECIRLELEQAMELGFKCPECGMLLEREDNSKKIAELRESISELEKQAVKPAKIIKKKFHKAMPSKSGLLKKKKTKSHIKKPYTHQIQKKTARPSAKKPVSGATQKKITGKRVEPGEIREKPDLKRIKERMETRHGSSPLKNLLKTSLRKFYKR